jgi:RNA exonuclease 1
VVSNLPVKSFGIESHLPSIVEDMDVIPKELSFFKKQFDRLIVTTAPGNKYSIYPAINAFTQRALVKREKKILTDQLKNEKVTLFSLKMTAESLSAFSYPIHPDTEGVAPENAEPLSDGWVDTKPFDHDGSHTFALDCEMCETAKGKVLTRVSIVDFNDNIILDELVKPDDEITDYLTLYSGITEEKLRNVTTTLEDIQSKLLERISSTDFLIGHSLENDLNVLKIRHPNIVDTSVIFEHPKGAPYKSSLKYLTNKYLNKVIQESSHDSVEDSRCCLELIKLKLVEGGLLGRVIGNVPISEDLRKFKKTATIIDYGRVQANQNTFIQCQDDDSVVDAIINSIDNSDLVIANMRDFERMQTASEEDLSKLFIKLNERLTKIYGSIPNNAAIIISSGSGDLTEFNKLKLQKEAFAKDYKHNTEPPQEAQSSWTLDDEEKFAESLNQAKLGATFLKVKTFDVNDTNESNENAIEE